MKAAVIYELNTPMQIEEVTLDEPQGREILVKLEAAGSCHSDLYFIRGRIPVPLPLVMGHEGAGIVEKVGPDVTNIKPGDHVILMVAYNCGECRYCRAGRPTLCVENLMIQATCALPGGGLRFRKDDQQLHQLFGLGCFAEYTVVHECSVVKVRDDAPFDVACLLGCGISAGVGAVLNTSDLRVGESIIIFGCGGVGLSAVMAAKLAGAGMIIAVDIDDNKLEIAKSFGADVIINSTKEDPQQKAVAVSGGGVNYSIPCIGDKDVIMQAFGSICPGGKCVVVGLPPIGTNLDIAPYELLQGKVITGTTQGDVNTHIDIPRYIDLFMDGKLPLDKLITNHCDLSEVNETYEALERGEQLRTIFQC